LATAAAFVGMTVYQTLSIRWAVSNHRRVEVDRTIDFHQESDAHQKTTRQADEQRRGVIPTTYTCCIVVPTKATAVELQQIN